MSIYRSIKNELEHFGEEITVTSKSGTRLIKGILQPLLYKNKMYLGGKQVPSGFFDAGHYLLICPAYIKLPTVGDVFLESKSGSFILKRSETVSINEKALYIWAVLCPYEKPVEDDFNEA